MNRREFAKLAAAGTVSSGAAADVQPTCFDATTGEWKIAWPGRISQHDVVYLSPAEDPALGLPIGNGDLGALLWTTEEQLIVAINKCDTWDDGPPGQYRDVEEEITCLRHAGRVVVDFGAPVFDLIYLREFQGRVALATAEATLDSQTPFSRIRVNSFVSADPGVLVMECGWSGQECPAPRVRVERWGSRSFSRWYSHVKRDPAVGLDGTSTSVERGRIVIRQKTRSLEFVVAAELVAGEAARFRRSGSRGGVAEPGDGFTLYLTVVTSENHPDPVAKAHANLDSARKQGTAPLRARHHAQWRQFWLASMVDLPEKYLASIWHLSLYFANSSSRGASPPRFCNGLWGWNHDFSPWTAYFHWNMQDYVWPLHAANHAELALPYFRYRRESLPIATQFCSDVMKKPGAFYADVANRRGYMARHSKIERNCTPGAQIALDFWRHYRFTGDRKFLVESAWPVIREVARFNAANIIEASDGLFHIHQTSAYEGSPLFDDTITDLAMIRGLLPVAIEAGKQMGHDPAELAEWQRRLDNLAPFRMGELRPGEYTETSGGMIHRGGIGSGRPVESKRVFLVGRDAQGHWLRNRYSDLTNKASYYGIPDPELAVVFPSNVIGLAQRGSELFRAAVTEVRLHPTADVDPNAEKPASMEGRGDQCMGWCPYPIVLARLGLRDELAAELANSVSTWQFYPQGFGHYGPYYVFKPEYEKRWLFNQPVDIETRKKFKFPTWPFRHFDIEAMPIVSCAINEMLLQSHESAIRVCPSVPAGWDVRFELAAQGGFLVSAEQLQDSLRFVSVVSRNGGECRLVRPWTGPIVCRDMTTSAAHEFHEVAGEVRFQTVAGRRYLLLRDAAELQRWQVEEQSPEPASGARHLKNAQLGRERLF